MDITDYCGLDSLFQEVELNWPINESVKEYGVGLFLATKLTVDETLSILEKKEYVRSCDDTLKLGMINLLYFISLNLRISINVK